MEPTPGFDEEVRSALARALYRAAFPITSLVMKASMGISDEAAIDRGLQGTEQGLDFVAREAGNNGFLVGNRLSVADITAASLLAPAVMPENSPMDLPKPRPDSVNHWLARWADHPGADWVRQTYRKHRGAK